MDLPLTPEQAHGIVNHAYDCIEQSMDTKAATAQIHCAFIAASAVELIKMGHPLYAVTSLSAMLAEIIGRHPELTDIVMQSMDAYADIQQHKKETRQ